ncbi:NADP-dependent oxidoreductase domain-containing protein [Amanita rubescens]|nr:NADP-dependent oxidoreductase domain-containing protein [Amanita rubescens]
MAHRTYRSYGNDAYNAITWVIYAHDSAEWYENEREIYITTKLKRNGGHRWTSRVRQSIKRSLKECGLGYIDLYVIHGPLGGREARKESWRAICDAQKEGVIKSIGIGLLLRYQLPFPAVRQKFCGEHDIIFEAWASLVRGLHMQHSSIGEPAVNLGQGYIPMPKSSRKDRIARNMNILELDGLDEGWSSIRRPPL